MADIARYLEDLYSCMSPDLYDTMYATQRGAGFILSCLERADGEVFAGDLAAELRVSSARIAALLKKMEQNGLVVRRPSAEDKRRIIVEITPAGTALIDELRSQAFRRVEHLLDEVGEEELQNFIRISRRIKEVLRT